MRSITVVFILSLGLIASAQTPSQDSRNIPQTPPATNYLLTPPNVALPGSGVATGQPLRNDVNINDARNPQGGAVFQPAAGNAPVADTYRVSTPVTSVEGSSQAVSASAETSSESVNGGGMTNFSTGAPGSLANNKSLAEIAAEVRGNKPGIGKRSFDNSDIAALGNTVGNQPVELPQSDEASSASNARGPYTTPSGEEVLDRADYDAVQAALARSSQKAEQQTADQGNEVLMAQNQQPANPQQSSSEVESTPEPAREEAAVNNDNEEESTDTLPQTSSTLPLFALLGLGALTFGMVFRNARRSF